MAFRQLDKLCRQVVSRLNTDDLGGSELRAGPMKEDDRPGSEGEDTPDRSPIAVEEPRTETVKRPTRSRDGWTLPKPRKVTGAEAPAKFGSFGGMRSNSTTKPSPSLRETARPVLLINNKCLPARPKASVPLLGAGSHLRLVGGVDHSAASFSGAGT